MRGEHRDSFMGLASVLGSSPHARGARSCGACGACGPGIIPACAGSTPQVLPQAMIWRDHPRMRGEHYRIGGSVFNDGGSSPHARGALLVVVTCCCYAGIIPACAGSTSASHLPYLEPGDHPRMRGEHYTDAELDQIKQGSSPHARGAPSARRWGTTRRGDHPRMRGEHLMTAFRNPSLVGSSPHARGARRQGGSAGRGYGIIPACAGSTTPSTPGLWPPWDHPRMRGEHNARHIGYAVCEGSSPHARGAPRRLFCPLARRGIIPACAGSTTRA